MEDEQLVKQASPGTNSPSEHMTIANFFRPWHDLTVQANAMKMKLEEQDRLISCKEAEMLDLKEKLHALSKDLAMKEATLTELTSELKRSRDESAAANERLERIGENLAQVNEDNMKMRLKVTEKEDAVTKLSAENEEQKIALDKFSKSVEGQQNVVSDLQARIQELIEEKERLLKEHDTEIKGTESALEEAIEERAAMDGTFLKKFERERSLHAEREHQLLSDFEWKLREVEQGWKKRLDEHRANSAAQLERISSEKEDLEMQVNEELSHSKSVEAEAAQLRGLIQEQQKGLRVSSQQLEQHKRDERQQKDDVGKLQALLEMERDKIQALKASHHNQLEQELYLARNKFENLKAKLNLEWENRLFMETTRLKNELDQLHSEETQMAIDTLKRQKQQELNETILQWKIKEQESNEQIKCLKENLSSRESQFTKDLEKATTNADREIWGLRRNLQRMDMKNQEDVEKINEAHQREIDRLREEYDQRLLVSDQKGQMQVSSVRATVELVKEQMGRDIREAELKLEDERKKHAQEIRDQRQELERTNDLSLKQMSEEHELEIEKIRSQNKSELTAQLQLVVGKSKDGRKEVEKMEKAIQVGKTPSAMAMSNAVRIENDIDARPDAAANNQKATFPNASRLDEQACVKVINESKNILSLSQSKFADEVPQSQSIRRDSIPSTLDRMDNKSVRPGRPAEHALNNSVAPQTQPPAAAHSPGMQNPVSRGNNQKDVATNPHQQRCQSTFSQRHAVLEDATTNEQCPKPRIPTDTSRDSCSSGGTTKERILLRSVSNDNGDPKKTRAYISKRSDSEPDHPKVDQGSHSCRLSSDAQTSNEHPALKEFARNKVIQFPEHRISTSSLDTTELIYPEGTGLDEFCIDLPPLHIETKTDSQDDESCWTQVQTQRRKKRGSLKRESNENSVQSTAAAAVVSQPRSPTSQLGQQQGSTNQQARTPKVNKAKWWKKN